MVATCLTHKDNETFYQQKKKKKILRQYLPEKNIKIVRQQVLGIQAMYRGDQSGLLLFCFFQLSSKSKYK